MHSILIFRHDEERAFSYWESAHVIGPIDTLIVGGGIVGLSAALRRCEMDSNERVVIVERDALSGGGSTKNAGFACFGSPSELLSDLRQMSRDEVIELIPEALERSARASQVGR